MKDDASETASQWALLMRNLKKLTRLSHLWNGKVLFVGHETQDGEDGKTCNKASATVQKTEGQAVSENSTDRKI